MFFMVSLTATGLAAGEDKQSSRPKSALSPPICFELTLAEWKWVSRSKGSGTPQPEPFWIPPSRIKLESAPPSDAECERFWVAKGFAVRPDGVAPGHWLFEVGTWEVESSGQVYISWGGGYVHTTLRVPRLAEVVRGNLEVWSDDLNAPRPGCTTELRRVTCR